MPEVVQARPAAGRPRLQPGRVHHQAVLAVDDLDAVGVQADHLPGSPPGAQTVAVLRSWGGGRAGPQTRSRPRRRSHKTFLTIVEDMSTTRKAFHHKGSRLRATEKASYAEFGIARS